MTATRTEISELWRQVNRRMHELFRHAFRETVLVPPAFFMLRQISREPGVTVSELARRVDMVKSHVSKTVDHLAHQGYLEKRSDPEDHRLTRLYPTPSAQALVTRTEERVRQVWDEVVAGVPDERLDEVVRGLQVLLAALERHSGRPKGS